MNTICTEIWADKLCWYIVGLVNSYKLTSALKELIEITIVIHHRLLFIKMHFNSYIKTFIKKSNITNVSLVFSLLINTSKTEGLFLTSLNAQVIIKCL